jgi:hypothetical protein
MSIATQLLSKHVSAAMDTHKAMEELLEMVFFYVVRAEAM